MIQVPFGSLPGTSALFLDYVSDWKRVQRFYQHSYSLDSIVDFARKRAQEPLPHRESLCRVLSEQQVKWGGSAESVERLRQGAVAVVGGQQPGLFTGPLYTILKAITAIKLSEALNNAGVPTVPVFWVAAEDHDFEEIQWASVLDRESNLRRIRVDLSNESASPSGWLHYKDDVATAVSECLSILPQSEFQPELRDILENSYRVGSSPVDAFARMMAQLFGDKGLILADPLDPRFKEIARPILSRVVARNGELRQAVVARSRSISAAGYHEQVRVDENFTGLFALKGTSRQALKPEDLDSSNLLSPNVLVRPAIQDSIFPNVAFVAGPAEVAYLAQAAVVYEILETKAAPIYPRISATILEARVNKSLKKYNFEFTDVFRGKEFMKRRAVETELGAERFVAAKERIREAVDSLGPVLNAVDPTLLGALDNARQKMIYQVETLETKFVNAETRRNELMERQLELIVNSLFPDKKLQERQLNVASFVARYGTGFLNKLRDAVSLDSTQHQIVEI